jgi:hypothetical protein
MAKYLELISVSKDAKEQAALQLEAKKAGINLQAATFQAEVRVGEAEASVAEAASRVPFNINAYVGAKRALAAAKEDLADLEATKAELFA